VRIVPEVSGREVLSELPRQLRELLQHELELAGLVVAPIDAVLDLLEESAATLRRQAEALEAAGVALAQTAELMKRQAELFERTTGMVHRPAKVARAVASSATKPRKRARKPGG
jgi:hypothetical protein